MQNTETRVPFTIKLGYGIGDIGSNIFIIASGLYLLYFMTNVLGVEPALAGLALFVPKLWDVVSDPMMGYVSDNTNSRWGRRRPYLLAAALPFGVTFALLFSAPSLRGPGAALYVGLMFAAVCTAFTVFNVPYASMVAEMSDDYNERMSITSFRMISASIGVLLAGGLAMPLVKAGGEGVSGYRFMGLVLGAAISVFCLACFWFTRRAPFRGTSENPPPLLEQARIAAANFPFVMLMLSYLLQSLGMGVLMAGLIYYVKYVMQMPETNMGVIFPLFLVTAIVVMPLWVKVGYRFGKIRAYRVGLLLLMLSLSSFFFTTASQPGVFYAQVTLLGIGFSSFQLFPFSMLPDTIEYDEIRSGLRREGVFSGFWSSGQKIAYSVGPTIVGFALSLSGFVADAPQQVSSVSLYIRIVFCLVPPVLLLLSFIPFGRYDMTEEKFVEIRRKIDSGLHP